MPAVLHFKKWKKNINFLTFQRIALCPSLHSKCAKNSIDRIFINNSSLRQNNILSDCYPVLFQYLCIVLQNLGKKKKEKKRVTLLHEVSSLMLSVTVLCEAS